MQTKIWGKFSLKFYVSSLMLPILPLKCEKTSSSRLLSQLLPTPSALFIRLFVFFKGFSNICIPFGMVILKCECMQTILFKILAPHPQPSPKAGTLPTRSLRITHWIQGRVLLILRENPNTHVKGPGRCHCPPTFHQKKIYIYIHVYVNRTIFHIHSDFLSIWA